MEKDKPEKKEAMSDRSFMDLKEAEKTIANKDVIIKMLQEQVKKLEAAYKENLKETENFRYKFCLASEQIKRLRTCPQTADKNEDENQIKELKSDLAKWKTKCDELTSCKETTAIPEKCRYLQQTQEIEKIMNSHYDLLQTLVQKILETSTKDNELGTIKPYEDQIAQLQKEIDRLKEENRELQKMQTPEDDEPPQIETNIEAKDSLIDAYRRSHVNLQHKVSVLLTNDRDEDAESGSIDLKDRKVSFSERTAMMNESATKIHFENDFEMSEETNTKHSIQDLNTLVLGEEAGCKTREACCRTRHAEAQTYILSPEETKESDSLLETQEEDDIDERVVQSSSSDPFSKDGLPSEDIKNVEDDGVTTQRKRCLCITTYNPICVCDSKDTVDLHSVPSEHEASDGESESNTTERFESGNVQDMVQKLNDIGNRVAEVLEKQVQTCKDLESLKTDLAESRGTTESCNDNITKLSARIDEQKSAFLEKFQEHQQVTDNLMTANKEITAELSALRDKIEGLFQNIDQLNQKSKPTEAKESQKKFDEACSCAEALTTNYVNLQEVNVQKDKQIRCIDALISYYKQAHENVVALNSEVAQKIEKEIQQPQGDEELDKIMENARNENLKLRTTISSVIDCLTIKVSELKTGSIPEEAENCPRKVTAPLELEDIYQAVKSTVIHNCRGCTCVPSYTVSDTCTCYSSDPSEADIYSCLFCACASDTKIVTKREVARNGKESNADLSAFEPRRSANSAMINNLETYIHYLHEQLNIVTSIETRIEDLRLRMKESRESVCKC